MKATELRIGNWYITDIIGGGYDKITAKDILELNDDPLDDYYQPIPLTEEILLKAGFHIGEGDDLGLSEFNSVFWIEGLYIMEYIGDYEGFSFYHSDDEDDVRMIRYVKYLHQLQNLYFALTGEELNIEL